MTEIAHPQSVNPKIEKSWLNALQPEFEKEYFLNLKQFLIQEKQKHIIFPAGDQLFSAFNITPFHQVKVVLLGQDPYHGPNQAHGLSFSVQKGIRQPPSLKNIFKELESDLGIQHPQNGDLTPWARQGVLLLNATLTVRAKEAGSHQGKGWENFTDAVIKTLSKERTGLVFLLWGNFAKQKEILIDPKKHLILKSVHPSPFSARNGFFGCKHFSKTNEFLRNNGTSEIDWRIE